jgi:hypothetical protein
MIRRNEEYFEERKVRELIRFSLAKLPIEKKFAGTIDIRFRNVCDSYWRAIQRVLEFSGHSVWIQISSIDFGLRLQKAIHDETGTFSPSALIIKKINDSIRLRMRTVGPEPSSKGERYLINRISSVTRTWMRDANVRMLESFDLIMPSLIVLAWTAFEVLCEDLLEKGIDICPSSLGSLSGRGRKRSLATWEAVDRKGNPKLFSQRSAGPIKREDLGYRTISQIRDAYWVAFNSDAAAIDRVLRNRDIDSLFALRNIIVHRDGRVDKMFLSRVDGLPMFASAKDGERLQLKFDLLKNLVRPVLIHGFKLIQTVSKWVAEHPDGDVEE